MALRSNTGLHQSRLTHPVRDIAYSYVLLHNIEYSLEDSVSRADFISLLVWPAEEKKRKKTKTKKKPRKTQTRNVNCRTSSPMLILYFVPTLYIPKPTVIDWIGGSREAIPCVRAPFLLAYQSTLTSHEPRRMTLQPCLG